MNKRKNKGFSLLYRTENLPLPDNLVINPGDQLKFLAGDYAFLVIEEDGVIQLNSTAV
ncbi:MAG: hypothetical protein IPJ40_16560 [Saprospirales bacterium]|nr:hypothetical protein [Saprospirales bacterium]